MFDWFRQRERRSDQPLKLVVIGREALPVPFDDDIIYLGFVSEEEKWQAMAACSWMLLPSRYESLSIALLETWMAGRPGIVSAESEVLKGHCRRSNGGLWFHDWRECEAIVQLVDTRTQAALGLNGRNYVKTSYSWSRVEREYLSVVSPQIDAKVQP
jgi:glycosyltransferase involved in cell wall biosynthesis